MQLDWNNKATYEIDGEEVEAEEYTIATLENIERWIRWNAFAIVLLALIVAVK